MKTIKVSEATNTQLDWLVAKCEGLNPNTDYYAPKRFGLFSGWREADGFGYAIKNYTADWSQMGPIIEREGINISVHYQDDALSNDMVQIGWNGNLWNSSVPGTSGFLQWAYGPTPLIAAARCFVVSKLGDTVEVPDEL